VSARGQAELLAQFLEEGEGEEESERSPARGSVARSTAELARSSAVTVVADGRRSRPVDSLASGAACGLVRGPPHLGRARLNPLNSLNPFAKLCCRAHAAVRVCCPVAPRPGAGVLIDALGGAGRLRAGLLGARRSPKNRARQEREDADCEAEDLVRLLSRG
jgi:hypothetical protein